MQFEGILRGSGDYSLGPEHRLIRLQGHKLGLQVPSRSHAPVAMGSPHACCNSHAAKLQFDAQFLSSSSKVPSVLEMGTIEHCKLLHTEAQLPIEVTQQFGNVQGLQQEELQDQVETRTVKPLS